MVDLLLKSRYLFSQFASLGVRAFPERQCPVKARESRGLCVAEQFVSAIVCPTAGHLAPHVFGRATWAARILFVSPTGLSLQRSERVVHVGNIHGAAAASPMDVAFKVS
jgi:hypothetical protein